MGRALQKTLRKQAYLNILKILPRRGGSNEYPQSVFEQK